MTNNQNEVTVAKEAGGNLAESQMAISLGETFGAPPQSIINLIRNQIIAVPANDPPPTAAETAYVMSNMVKYGLDPFARMCSAWRDNRGKLCFAIEQNGWRIQAGRQPGFMFVDFEEGPVVDSPDGKGKPCYEWVQATVHDRDMGEVKCPKVWLEEEYVPQRGNYAANWQQMPKRRLPQRAFCLAIRMVYGIDAYDPFDREMMQSGKPKIEQASDATQAAMAGLAAAAKPKEPEVEAEDAEFEDVDDNGPEPSVDFEKAQEYEDEMNKRNNQAIDASQQAQDGLELAGHDPEVQSDPEADSGESGASGGKSHIEREEYPRKDFCAVYGCNLSGMNFCKECGQGFCSAHMASDGLCRICGGE